MNKNKSYIDGIPAEFYDSKEWKEIALDLENQIKILEEEKTQFIQLVNKVQECLGTFQTNSSDIFIPIRKAWNMNAKFLADNFKLQTEWLEEHVKNENRKFT